MSASMRVSRGVAVGPVSRADQETVVGVPGSSVASMTVRPAADVRRTTRPGETRRSDCSPGTSNVAVALPAGGTGSTNEPRPGEVVTAAPQSSVAENVAGPVTIATCALPSAMSGSGRSPVRASSSVAWLMSGTLTAPVWKTSPSTVIVARTLPAATRTRRSARVSAAGSGAPSGGRGCPAARSSRRS